MTRTVLTTEEVRLLIAGLDALVADLGKAIKRKPPVWEVDTKVYERAIDRLDRAAALDLIDRLRVSPEVTI